MNDVPIEEILKVADLEPFDSEELEGAAVVDAVVIFRYQHPDWPKPRAAYVSTQSMASELLIGIMTIVLDRMRAHSAAAWEDDD